jgi:hypothetical protein
LTWWMPSDLKKHRVLRLWELGSEHWT